MWQNSGAVWQSLGGGPSNWDTWVHKKTLFGGSPIMGGHKVGVAAIPLVLGRPSVGRPASHATEPAAAAAEVTQHSRVDAAGTNALQFLPRSIVTT